MACDRVNFTCTLLVVAAAAAVGGGGVITLSLIYLALSIHLHGAAEILLDNFVWGMCVNIWQ
jgi:hypothetical protein